MNMASKESYQDLLRVLDEAENGPFVDEKGWTGEGKEIDNYSIRS